LETEGKSAYFPAGSWFLDDVYDAPKADSSDSMISALRAAGGWGNGDLFQIDFAIDVLTADPAAPLESFTPRTKDNGFDEDAFYTPDCDEELVPNPPDGNVEGYEDYDCAEGGDCHLIVYQPSEHKLYEAWRASISDGEFVSGCLAVWDTSRAPSLAGRGLQCTSADAAGFPIAPLLFTADEVQAGKIEHAIRFILPNDRPHIGFVPPATHGTETDGPEGAPYYGVHLRLRRDYPLESLPSEGARVVARALQHYGMYHADGGDIALTAQSDTHTDAKWEGLLDPHDLAELQVEDFEVIEHGAPIELTYDCVR
jgi:serine/threonine-protein kinase